jgi:cobalt-zinc-cadmium resistance protein CzcA
VLIIIVLLFTFRRLRPTIIILTHVPFACVGGMILLWLRDMPISISAAIGFIALSGIAVMNGVVLLSQVRAIEDSGLGAAQAIASAARTRARPVLMTALVAALGFVPMMLGTGIGSEVQRPLATVVVGGLFTSTMLTLVVLPSLYPWLAEPRLTRLIRRVRGREGAA